MDTAMTLLRTILITILLVLTLEATASALEVQFKKSALVKGDAITLGEVATIIPSSSAAAAALAGQSLGYSPEPGKRTVLQASEIEQYLVARDPGAGAVTWSGAESVTVVRDAIEIGPADIREYLEAYIERKKDILPDAEIRFRRLDLPQPFYLTTGDLEVEIFPADPAILKSKRFTLIFRVDGRVEKNIAAHGELEAIAPVVIATNDLVRGMVVQPQDVNVARMDIIGLTSPAYSEAEVVGKKLNRSVRQGKPVRREWITTPPLILKGQMVTIVARKDGLVVTARGIARHDAVAGGVAKVINSNSQKEIQGLVSAPGEVTVEL